MCKIFESEIVANKVKMAILREHGVWISLTASESALVVLCRCICNGKSLRSVTSSFDGIPIVHRNGMDSFWRNLAISEEQSDILRLYASLTCSTAAKQIAQERSIVAGEHSL